MLQLGTNCVNVPWGDGGRTSITTVVRAVSNMLRNDANVSVASVALSTLAALDAFMTPRAPPILIPTRDGGSDSGGLTASALMQGMNESKMEMDKAAAREVKKEEQRSSRSSKKKSDKSNKKAKKDMAQIEAKALLEPKEVQAAAAAPNPKVSEDVSGSKRTEKTAAVKKSSAAANKRDNEKASSKKSNVMKKKKTSNDNAQDELQIVDNKKPGDDAAMNDTSITADDDVKMNDKSDDNEESGDDDDDSSSGMDDFPDIVDEDPDEGDRN